MAPRFRALAVALAAVIAAGVLAVVLRDGDGDGASSARPPTTVRADDPSGASGDAASEGSGASGEHAEAPTTTAPPSSEARAVVDDPPSAEALAGAIAAAERAIRDPGTPDEHLEGWAHVQQRAYRELARRPEWDAPVAEHVGAELAPVVEANVSANRELWALTTPREELPDWTIVAPPPPDELLDHYRSAGAELGIPWPYLASIHLVESRMGRIRGDSVAGARGPMQFMPATWEAYGEGDIEDPADAIRAAARYLAAHGAPDDMDGALFAYNHSDRYVRAVRAYAEVMAADERAYLGYHHWQVYYRTVDGDVLLPVGWEG